jgi:hypothetical protein
MNASMDDGAGGRPRDALGAELRALARLALDRLDPLLARATEAVPTPAAGGAAEGRRGRGPEPDAACAADQPDAGAPAGGAHPCASCPVCAAMTGLRRERPELVGQLAEHAAGLLAALRAALEEGAPVPPGPTADRTDRPVHPIPVDRVPGEHAGRTRGATSTGAGPPC